MKISRDDFISLVKQNVHAGTKIDEIKLEDRLADIGIDSLGFATLLWAIEEKFKVQVDDTYLKNLNNLTTVADLIAAFKEIGHEIEIESVA